MDANNIRKLADAAGIEPFYWDNHGYRHDASPETIRGLLKAFGIAADNDDEVWASLTEFWRAPWMRLLLPVHTALADEALSVPLRAWEEDGERQIQWQLVLEDGSKREGACRLGDLPHDDIAYFDNRRIFQHRLRLPPCPAGYHIFRVEGETEAMRLIVAPPRCFLPPDLDKAWGLMIQLYALKTTSDWGMGDFTALQQLTDHVAKAGGAAIGLNPLHALFLEKPDNASPYSPCSRLFRNPLYLDVTAIADFAECAAAQELAASPAYAAVLAELRQAEFVDYDKVAALKLPVLEQLYAHFQTHHLAKHTPRGEAFWRYFIAKGRNLKDFTTFQALAEHFHDHDWRRWPAAFHDPRSEAVSSFRATRADRLAFFRYLQWQTELQFAAAADHAKTSGLGIGLYNDLAVSADATSADHWMHRSLFAGAARVGAPPDPFNELGQDWGLVPLNPLRLKDSGFALYRTLLAANMDHAGALRIDHVMGLTRLYLIPEGMKPTEGAYVRFPLHELLAVAALESQRHHCMVVGEDLGTVPGGFRERLFETAILGSRVLYFERGGEGFAPADSYPPLAAVSVSTHDLATLKGWWEGNDLGAKARLGLFKTGQEQEAALSGRRDERRQLLQALEEQHLLPDGITADSAWSDNLTPAVHAWLAKAPSALFMVQLDDLAGQAHQANLPGSIHEYPNWRRRLPRSLEELMADPAVKAEMAALRR